MKSFVLNRTSDQIHFAVRDLFKLLRQEAEKRRELQYAPLGPLPQPAAITIQMLPDGTLHCEENWDAQEAALNRYRQEVRDGIKSDINGP